MESPSGRPKRVWNALPGYGKRVVYWKTRRPRRHFLDLEPGPDFPFYLRHRLARFTRLERRVRNHSRLDLWPRNLGEDPLPEAGPTSSCRAQCAYFCAAAGLSFLHAIGVSLPRLLRECHGRRQSSHLPANAGRISRYFVTDKVAVPPGSGTGFVSVLYAAANAPLSFATDGLIVQLLRRGKVLAQEKLAVNLLWKRSDAHSLFVGAETEIGEGAPSPVTIAMAISWPGGQQRIATPQSLAAPRDALVTLEAPPVIDTRAGKAQFVGWHAIIDADLSQRTAVTGIMAGEPTQNRVSVRMSEDASIRARYRLITPLQEPKRDDRGFFPGKRGPGMPRQ